MGWEKYFLEGQTASGGGSEADNKALQRVSGATLSSVQEDDPDVLHEYASDYWQKFFPPSKCPPAGQLPANLWGS